MKQLLKEIRDTPLLWLLTFVPMKFAAAKLKPDTHTLIFGWSALVLAPLPTLPSHATESVAAQGAVTESSFGK